MTLTPFVGDQLHDPDQFGVLGAQSPQRVARVTPQQRVQQPRLR
jgi:hypothetical protein